MPIRKIFPVANGSIVEWDQYPEEGEHWQKIIDDPHDSDITRVLSRIYGSSIYFSFYNQDSLVPSGAYIYRLEMFCISRGDAGHDPMVEFRYMEEGGAEHGIGTFQTTTDGVYHERSSAYELVSPVTGYPWTFEEFSTGEFGLVHLGPYSNTEWRHVTQLYIHLWYTNSLVSRGAARNIIGCDFVVEDGTGGIFDRTPMAQRYTTPEEDLTVESVVFYPVFNSGTPPKVAIYDDATGALVATGIGSQQVVDRQWYTVPLSSPVVLQANTDYWVAISVPYIRIPYANFSPPTPIAKRWDQSYDDFPPSTFPESGTTDETRLYSMYAFAGWAPNSGHRLYTLMPQTEYRNDFPRIFSFSPQVEYSSEAVRLFGFTAMVEYVEDGVGVQNWHAGQII